MKIFEKENNVQVLDDIIEKQDFKISMGSKMFSILSDGLYSDKVLACIRELSVNALDAHIAAKNEHTPFIVHIPTWNNNTFFIRDFGTGLSKKDVFELYSTYGMSSKDNSNEYTGCLGLGSKTPFAYNTRTFVVTSYFDGVKYDYQCMLSSSGIPSISLISEEPTSEPNGLKIAFPVKKGEENLFVDRAKRVYRYFKVKPKVVGYSVTFDNISYTYKSQKWGVRDSTSSYYSNECRIVMGSISYPLSHNHFDSKFSNLITNGRIDIYTDIGDVSIEVSREGLSYDDKTKLFISGILNSVIKEAESHFEKSISGATTLWDARITFKKTWDNYQSELRGFIDLNNIRWNNAKIWDNSTYFTWNTKYHEAIRTFKRKNWGRTKVSIDEGHKGMSLSCEAVFFEDDLKTTGITRIKDAITSGTYANIILLNFKDSKDRQAFIDECGMTDDSLILKTSSLPYNKPVRTYSKRGKIGTGLTFNHKESYVTKQWVDTTIDYNNPGIYLEVNGYKVTNTIFTNDDVRILIEECGIKDTIYGLKKASLKNAVNSPNWQHFDKYILPFIDKYISDNATSMYLKDSSINYYLKNSLQLVLGRSMSKDAAFIKAAKILINDNTSRISHFIQYYKTLTGTDHKSLSGAKKEVEDSLNYVLTKYEILSDISDNNVYAYNFEKGIKKFIELVDSI